MTKVLLFVDMEFPRVRGAKVEKSWKFQEEGGTIKPLGTENPGGWGVKLEETLRGGYGYFMEPHIYCFPLLLLSTVSTKSLFPLF